MLYSFADADPARRDLLGGKGAGLTVLTRAGLPVPPGLIVPTTLADAIAARTPPAGFEADLHAAVDAVGDTLGRRFGDPDRPLLLAVRSGAAVSMPGMMRTLLNVGLTDATAAGLARLHGGDDAAEAFALECYCRLIAAYGEAIAGATRGDFEVAAAAADVAEDRADPARWRDALARFKGVYLAAAGHAFPQDAHEQLRGALVAVFASARGGRAEAYRRAKGLPALPTAAVVQAMVFGNLGEDSCTGVAFTRDPATGENRLYGEFIPQAQGEDLVAGGMTPDAIVPDLQLWNEDVFDRLDAWRPVLERHFGDAQDVEFTVERGRLFLLQTRTAQRTAAAAVRMAVEMAEEGLIDRRTALARIAPDSLARLLRPTIDPAAATDLLGHGLPASPGVAAGRPAFTADEAVRRAAAGERVILVRPETDTDDISGIAAASGVLTSSGGLTSHASLVARDLNRPCVVGMETLTIDAAHRTLTFDDGRTLGADATLTIDGDGGVAYAGDVPTVARPADRHLATLLDWARAAGDAFAPLLRAASEARADD